jgi:hypothetical protein
LTAAARFGCAAAEVYSRREEEKEKEKEKEEQGALLCTMVAEANRKEVSWQSVIQDIA